MFSFGKKSRGDAGSDNSDWVTDATAAIERVIDGIRDKAVVPLTTVARGIVYGLLALIVGLAALVILTIFAVRFLDVYLDYIPGVPENVWFAYAIAGAIFVIAGVLLWSKRSAKAPRS